MISRPCRVALAAAAVLTMCAVLPLLEVPPDPPEDIPCNDRPLLTERQKAEARATGYASFMASDGWHVEHVSNLTDYI